MSKTNWPGLKGLPFQEAVDAIKAEFPGMCVQVVPVNSGVTCDYRVDRVRVFIDKDNKVARPPQIG